MTTQSLTRDKTRWDIVWLAVGAGIACAFQVGKMPVSIPLLRAELDMSLVGAGIAVSMFNLIACLIGLTAGALADMAGARRVLLGGLLLTAAASLGGALATGETLLLVSRLVEGLGAIVVFVSGPIIIVRAIRPQDMRQAFGAWGSYMPIGTATMAALTPFLLGPIGWRGVWVVSGALLIAYATIFLFGTRAVADPPAAAPADRLPTVARDMKLVLRAPGPWLLGICFATYTANYLSVTTFLPTYFIERLKFDPTVAALLTAFVILGNAGGNLLGGRLLKLGLQRWHLITAASLIMGSCSFGIFLPGLPDWMPFVLAFAFSSLGGMLPASVLGGAAFFAPSPNQVGTTNGLVVQLGNFGMLLGPGVLAAVVSAAGWAAGPFVVMGSSLIGVAFAIAIGRAEAARTRALAG